MKVKFVQLESDAFLTDLDSQYHPEIREWLRQTFFFTPTKNDPAHFEKESQEIILDKRANRAIIYA